MGTFAIPQQMDTNPPGSKMAPKTHTIICCAERGKPYAFLCRNAEVSTPQGEEMAQRVEERDKKRMLPCNGVDRGSDFAPARKGADLSHGIS